MTQPQRVARPDLNHLNWAVEQRAEIQRTLLALYGYVRYNEPRQIPTTLLTDHCIAAAFSLWRAVFLADKVRTVFSAHEAQTNFLETVVTTNAINFPDDRRNSAWSVSFYLENAKHRLQQGAELAQEHLGFDGLNNVLLLIRLRGTGEVSYTRYEWECVHLALRTVFNIIAPADFKLTLVNPASPERSPLFSSESDEQVQAIEKLANPS